MRFELTTLRLVTWCSTSWATFANWGWDYTFNITTLIPVPNRGFLNVKNVSTHQLMSDVYGNNTAFIKEWLFSCRYETTQRSSYLWPCEPFTSAKMLSAEFHQTFSTLRVLKVPYSLSSTELGDLFSITVGVFAFFYLLRIVSMGVEPTTVCA